jgi:hypothetical protein
MRRLVAFVSGLLLVLALAMVVSAQTTPRGSDAWPIDIPNPWKHVESGPDTSTYADGLISWIHFAGDATRPELDEFRTSYFAHFRFGENASLLLPGEGPKQDWIHSLPASPYLPPEGK